MKKILVISYSQTGQLNNIIESILTPIKTSNNIKIFHKILKPKNDFKFPWNFFDFMEIFPECVFLDTIDLEEIKNENDFDLVILSYQVWFLSPSLPITSFLKSDFAREKLSNKPIITVIGCRNMWIIAQEKVKTLLKELKGNLIDNIVLVDQGNSFATFITTPRWMLTGKKDKFLGIFPKAGVSQKDIKNASRFGYAIKDALDKNTKLNSSICFGLEAVNVDIRTIKSEEIANKSFLIWGKFIKKFSALNTKKRKFLTMLYIVFLLFIIIFIVPINMLIQSILRIINKKKIQNLKEKYELPSGNENFRMKEFNNE